jgi:hypothetical protein
MSFCNNEPHNRMMIGKPAMIEEEQTKNVFEIDNRQK